MDSQNITIIGPGLDGLMPTAPVGRTSWANLDDDDRALMLAALLPHFHSFKRQERSFYGDDWRDDLATSDLDWAKCLYEFATLGDGTTFEQVLAQPADAAWNAAYYMGVSNVTYDDQEPA